MMRERQASLHTTHYHLWLVLLACLAITAPMIAQDSKRESVSEIASGTGKTEDAAIQAAMKNAVQQALGAFAESEESLKDGKFSEKIVVNSNGIVLEYDVLGVEELKGGFRVTIHAQVQKNGIVQELKVRNIPVKSGATEVYIDLSKKSENRLFEKRRVDRASELLKQALKQRPNILATTKASILHVKEKDIPNRFGGKSDKFELHVEFEYQFDWTTWLKYNAWLDSVLRKSRMVVESRTVEYGHEVFVHKRKGYFGRTDLGFFVPADSEFCKAHRRGKPNDFLYTLALLVDYRFDPKTNKAKTKWVMHKIEDQIWQKAFLTQPKLPSRGSEEKPEWRSGRKRFRFAEADQMITTAYGQVRLERGNIGSRLFEVEKTLSGRYDYCEFSPLRHTGYTPRQSDTFFLPYRDKQIIVVDVEDTDEKSKRRDGERNGSRRGGGRGVAPVPVKWDSKVELRWRSGQPFFGVPEKILPKSSFPETTPRQRR